MNSLENYSNISLVITKSGTHTPLVLYKKDEPVLNHLTVQYAQWGSGSNYVWRIAKWVKGEDKFDISGDEITFPEQTNRHWRRRDQPMHVRTGAKTYWGASGLLVNVTDAKILVMIVQDSETKIITILVDKVFDSVRCPLLLKTMRKHVRTGLREARVKGLRIQHVSPAILKKFVLNMGYNGTSRLYGEIVDDIRENKSNIVT